MKVNLRRDSAGKRIRPVIDGITFDSDAESRVYEGQLRPLERTGRIKQLQVHPEFKFYVNGVLVGTMKPDFTFVDEAGMFGNAGELRVWDVKGWKKSKKTGRLLPRVDREFGLKKKLMRALFSLEVECV